MPLLDTLVPNHGLRQGESITSHNGHARLIHQQDGNVVLYANLVNGPHPIWATNTNGRQTSNFILQSDGNIVLYDGQNQPCWSSNTSGHQVSRLTIQGDLNLVLYDGGNQPKWSSSTCNNQNGPFRTDRLGHNSELHANQKLTSANGKVELVHQPDGNVVLYVQGRAIWSTNTSNQQSQKFILQSDGNLVHYGPGNHPLWASSTSGRGSTVMVVQDDHNLVIYDQSGNPVWSSNTCNA